MKTEDKSQLIVDQVEIRPDFEIRREHTQTLKVFRRAKIFFWVVSLAFLGANAAQCIRQQQDYESTCFEDKTWIDFLMSEPWSLLSLINYISCAILLLVLKTKFSSPRQDVRMSGTLKFFMMLTILSFWVLILSFVILGFVNTSYIEVSTPDPASFFSIVITGAFMFFMVGIFAALDKKTSQPQLLQQESVIIIKTM